MTESEKPREGSTVSSLTHLLEEHKQIGSWADVEVDPSERLPPVVERDGVDEEDTSRPAPIRPTQRFSDNRYDGHDNRSDVHGPPRGPPFIAYVWNLNDSSKEEDIYFHFGGDQKVDSIAMCVRGKNTCHVYFKNGEDLQNAVENANVKPLMGRYLKIGYGHEEESRRSGYGGGQFSGPRGQRPASRSSYDGPPRTGSAYGGSTGAPRHFDGGHGYPNQPYGNAGGGGRYPQPYQNGGGQSYARQPSGGYDPYSTRSNSLRQNRGFGSNRSSVENLQNWHRGSSDNIGVPSAPRSRTESTSSQGQSAVIRKPTTKDIFGDAKPVDGDIYYKRLAEVEEKQRQKDQQEAEKRKKEAESSRSQGSSSVPHTPSTPAPPSRRSDAATPPQEPAPNNAPGSVVIMKRPRQPLLPTPNFPPVEPSPPVDPVHSTHIDNEQQREQSDVAETKPSTKTTGSQPKQQHTIKRVFKKTPDSKLDSLMDATTHPPPPHPGRGRGKGRGRGGQTGDRGNRHPGGNAERNATQQPSEPTKHPRGTGRGGRGGGRGGAHGGSGAVEKKPKKEDDKAIATQPEVPPPTAERAPATPPAVTNPPPEEKAQPPPPPPTVASAPVSSTPQEKKKKNKKQQLPTATAKQPNFSSGNKFAALGETNE